MFKHKLRKTLFTALLVLFTVCLTAGSAGCFLIVKKSAALDEGYKTVSYDLPQDGSTPDQYSAIENVGFMAKRLAGQEYWYSEMHSTVSTIMNQEVATYKQFYDGVLVYCDISTSALVNTAKQFCVAGGRVVWRSASGNKKTWDGLNTEWSDGEPEGNLSIDDYILQRGLPGTEFSVYVLNENTVLAEGTSERAQKNPDGTYSITLNLCTDLDGETAAAYYYKQQMRATGGLNGYPTFYSIQIIYTFDETWQILSAEVNESYSATMGFTVDCSSSSLTEYSYDESKAENSYFDDYYINYLNKDIAVSEEAITAAACLSNAFSGVMTEKTAFSLSLTMNGQPVDGTVYLDLDAMDIRASFGNITIWLEQSGDDFVLYLSYGGIKAQARLGSFISGDVGEGFDVDELLTQLGEGEFSLSEDGASAELDSVLTLFGMDIPVNFSFNASSDGIGLNHVEADITLFGTELSARLAFCDLTSAPAALSASERSQFKDIGGAIEILTDLITAEAYEINAQYQSGDAAITARLLLAPSPLSLKGELNLTLGNASYELAFICDGEYIYLTLANGGEPVKIKAELDRALEILSDILGVDLEEEFGSSDTLLTDELALPDLIYTALTDENFANIFGQPEADGTFAISVDATALLSVLGTDLQVGEVTAALGNGCVALSVCGAEITLSPKEAFAVDTEGFVYIEEGGDTLDILDFIEKLVDALSGKSLTFSGEAAFNAGGADISLDVSELTLNWSDGLQLYLEAVLSLDGRGHAVYLYYDGATVWVTYDKLGVTAQADDVESLVSQITELLASIGVELDFSAAVDPVSILSNLTIGSAGNGLALGLGDASVTIDFETEGLFDAIFVYNGLTLNGAISAGAAISPALPEVNFIGLAELLPALGSVREIIDNSGLSLSGRLDVDVDGNSLSFEGDISVDWVDGTVGFAIDGLVSLGETQIEVYAQYAHGKVKAVVGGENFGGVLGFEIDLDGGDIQSLSEGVVSLYNRVAAVINTLIADGEEEGLKEAENLQELLNMLGFGETSLDGISSVTSVAEGLDVVQVIDSLDIYVNDCGKLCVGYGDLSVELDFEKSGGVAFGIVYDSGFRLSLNGEYVPYTELLPPDIEYVTVSDITSLLDYTASSVELLVTTNITIDFTGSIYSTQSRYGKYNGKKYDISATVEYSYKEYLHASVSVISTTGDDTVIIEAYLVDVQPITSGGFTTGVSEDGDGTWDIYLSLSNGCNNPLKVYVPAGEVMNLASALVAALELGDLSVGNAQVDSLIGKLAALLDTELVNKRLTEAQIQKFASLGSSLIEQILGDTLSGYIGGLISDGSAAIAETRLKTGSSSYVKEIGRDENGALKIILDSTLIYGSENYADITALYQSDEGRLSSISVGNIYFGGTDYIKSLELKVSYGQSLTVGDLSNYYDFSGISDLVTTIVDSATHFEEDADGSVTFGTDDGGLTGEYVLNDLFTMSGNLTAKILFYTVDITINNLSVLIAEDNSLTINISLTVPAVQELNQVVTNGKTYVDVTIKGDMIYIRRKQETEWVKYVLVTKERTITNPVYEYRAMSLSEFSDDVIDQIFFILNAGSLITDKVSGGTSSGGAVEFNDYGDYLVKFLNSYQYSLSGDSQKWSFSLNGTTLSTLAGITLSDIQAEISAEGGVVKGLTASGQMYSLINFSLSLDYLNPQEHYNEGDKGTAGTDVEAALSDIFGIAFGDSSQQLSQRVLWDKLLAETGKGYFEYVEGSTTGITSGRLSFEYRNGAEEESFTAIDDENYIYNVLYYVKSDGSVSVYSVLDYPEIESYMPELDDYKAIWDDVVILTDSGLIVRGIYAKTFDVTVNSRYQTDYLSCDEDGVFVYRLDGVYRSTMLEKDVIIQTEEDGATVYYGLKGYSYGQDGEIIALETAYDDYGNLLFVLNVTADTTVYAVWERVYEFTFTAEYDSADAAFNVEYTEYYYAGELTESDLPEVPSVSGYYGEWKTEGGDSATGYIVNGDGAFRAEYSIEYYTVIINSELEEEGFAYTADGLYSYSVGTDFTYGSRVTLGSYADRAEYIFGGYYYYENGVEYTVTKDYFTDGSYAFMITDDAEYYVYWVARSVIITYNSDFDCKLPAASSPSIATMNGELSDATLEGHTLLGWFFYDEATENYSLASYQAIKNYCLANSDCVKTDEKGNYLIDVYALWITEVKVEITSVTCKNALIFLKWTIGGSYSGGTIAEGVSADIATSINMTSSAAVYYVVSSDGVTVSDTLNSGKSVELTSNTFSKDLTNATSANYGGAIVQVTFNFEAMSYEGDAYSVVNQQLIAEATDFKQK